MGRLISMLLWRSMNKKLPPLNWLRSFEASARCLNFTLAAEELNLTQAAVSKQVKNLESSLGVILFKRLPRGLELTKSGAAYLPAVHEAIERLAVATNELFGYGRAQILKLRVSIIFFNAWLAPRLADFKAKYPDIELRFTTTIWVDDRDPDQDAELEIRYGRGDWSGLQADRLTWDSLFPVCSPSLIRQGAPLARPEDLCHHTLLHVAGYEEGWGHWLKQAGCESVDASAGWHFDTLVAAFDMAQRGLGVALARSSLVSEPLKSGVLIAPFEEKVATDEAFYLVSSHMGEAGTHQAVFRDWLLEQAHLDRELSS